MRACDELRCGPRSIQVGVVGHHRGIHQSVQDRVSPGNDMQLRRLSSIHKHWPRVAAAHSCKAQQFLPFFSSFR